MYKIEGIFFTRLIFISGACTGKSHITIPSQVYGIYSIPPSFPTQFRAALCHSAGNIQ